MLVLYAVWPVSDGNDLAIVTVVEYQSGHIVDKGMELEMTTFEDRPPRSRSPRL